MRIIYVLKDISMSKQNQFYAISHRGQEFTDFGYHSRLPLALKDLSVNSLLVLAFIDIDQFQDQRYKSGGKRRPIGLSTFVHGLGISESSVRKAIKELKSKRIISVERRERVGVCYTSNILKLNSRYQIITLAFIIRMDINTLSKALILRIIMGSTERVRELGTISDVARMVNMSRDSVYKVFKELKEAGYIYEMDYSSYAIDIERVMISSEDTIHREVIDLRERNAYLISEIEKVNPAWRNG